MDENNTANAKRILKTLWDLENELRSAARNGVMLRGEEARRHLAEARRLLEGVTGNAPSNTGSEVQASDSTYVSPTDKH